MQALCPACNLAKGAKMLRKHQEELQTIAMDIRAGKPVKNIGAFITPGGGKSAFAMILAKHLAETLGWRICWIVPRDALRTQGENDFADLRKRNLFGHQSLIRASGNDVRPSRDYIGYVTTYQAVAQNPKLHEDEFRLRPYILILDECHHVPFKGESEDGEAAFYNAVAPLVELAKLRIFASGTLERHDGHKIAFWPYVRAVNAEIPRTEQDVDDLAWAFIRYRRSDALEQRAIVPLHFYAMDGRARWFDPKTSEERDVESMAESSKRDQSSVLQVVLETEYAKQLLDKCVENWKGYQQTVYGNAKLLVVAPGIAAAKDYCKHLHAAGLNALIATSDDSDEAKNNIERFKRDAQVLVTVGMAYEGLDVPQITHVAALTNIRSRPWIEQCICRANRTAEGKTHGFIYYPDDPRMHDIMNAIEAEQAAVVVTWPKERSGGGNGGGVQTVITPLYSEATHSRGVGLEDGTRTTYSETSVIEAAMQQHGIKGLSVVQAKQLLVSLGAAVVPNGDTSKPDYDKPVLTPSQQEKNYRASINNTVSRIASNLSGGIKELKNDHIVNINRVIKQRWGERNRCTVAQLQEILQWLDQRYGDVV
jgi:superfamily II DNA or RNA helicase